MNDGKRKGSIPLKGFRILTAAVLLLAAMSGFSSGAAAAGTSGASGPAGAIHEPAFLHYNHNEVSVKVPQFITPSLAAPTASPQVGAPQFAPNRAGANAANLGIVSHPTGLKGDGTQAVPFAVYSAADLANVNNYNTWGSVVKQVYYYKLWNNLSFTNAGNWIPIGGDATPFAGKFLGSGNTITATVSSSTYSAFGLFGVVGQWATIENLTLTASNVTNNMTGNTSGTNTTGVMVGENTGNISDCTVAGGAVSGAGDATGGLAGFNAGTITNSSSSADVSGAVYLGGLVGYNGAIGTINDSHATGSLTDSNNGDYDGGLAGFNAGNITGSQAGTSLNVIGQDAVGGLVGVNDGSINGSSYTGGGLCDNKASCIIGGLVGCNTGDITYSNVNVNGDITGTRQVGGLVGLDGSSGLVAGQISNCTVTVTGNVYGSDDDSQAIGGLVGASNATISNCTVNVSGNVSGPGGAADKSSDIGGLVGYSEGAISTCTATAASVYGNSYIGGLVGLSDMGSNIDNSSGKASGSQTVSAGVYGTGSDPWCLGGLVGGSAANIAQCHFTGSVSDPGSNGCSGGLVGLNAGGITNSYTDASVSGTWMVGGLAGLNEGTIDSSYAQGNVTGSGRDCAAGLVGLNMGSIEGCHASGNVTDKGGNWWYNKPHTPLGNGGLVGVNWGDSGTASITDSYATGNINNGGDDFDGGLVGVNLAYDGLASIADSYATGNIYDEETDGAGGLVGLNDAYNDRSGSNASITDSYATGNININNGFDDFDGGLVGLNDGDSGTASIANSYATGNLSDSSLGLDYNGGLVGVNYGDSGTASITDSYAIGSLMDTGALNYDGGLVGSNDGGSGTASITHAYATGCVSETASSGNCNGGLAGANCGDDGTASIADAYATGCVSDPGGSGDFSGGLVGKNDGSSGINASIGSSGLASISTSYAAGSVSGGSGDFSGGLAGLNANEHGTASIDSSYWDFTTTGQSLAGASGGTPSNSDNNRQSDSAMKLQGTFSGWDFNSTWGINATYSYPYLLPPVPHPTPHVTEITPDNGSTNGGTAVSVFDTEAGTDLSTVMAVYFGTDTQVPFTIARSVSGAVYLVATSPAGSGSVPVFVKTPAGTSNSATFTYVNNNNTGGGGGTATVPAPTLTEGTVTPSSVVINIADSGTVTGFNLYENGSAAAVNGSSPITATDNKASYTVGGLTAATAYTFTADAAFGSTVSGMSAPLKVTTSPPVLPSKAALTFSDVPAGFWAYADIYWMADHGYVHGVGGGLFKPHDPTTRAQFVTILTNILDLSGQGTVPFTDVSPSAWYYHSVVAAYDAHLIKGLSPTEFAPDQSITREQMADIVARVLTYKGINVKVSNPQAALSVFEDHGKIDSWAVQGSAVSVHEKVIQGLPAPDGGLLFAPLGTTTRAQATVMLRRLMSLL